MLIKAKRHSQLLYSHLLLSPPLYTSTTPHFIPLSFTQTYLSFYPPHPLAHHSSFPPSLLPSVFPSILPCIVFIPFTSFPCHPFSLHPLPASHPLLITSPRLLSTPAFTLCLSSGLLPPFSLSNNSSSSKHVHLFFISIQPFSKESNVLLGSSSSNGESMQHPSPVPTSTIY